MTNISLRRFEESDIDFAYKMILTEQWNDRREDVRRMLDYEPNGCFIAEANGEPAGHVFTVSYGKLGWIGYLIVDSEHRGRKVGTLLMKKAIDYLQSQGVETIKLEAVPEIADLYRKLGFVDEYNSLRFVGKSRKQASPESEDVSIMTAETLPAVEKFDEEYFGADRTKVISRLFRENSKHCFVSCSGKVVNGYVMCRNADTGYKLGPWVSNPKNPGTAKELLTVCISGLKKGENVYVGVLGMNKEAIKILHEFGFQEYSKSIRMRLGKRLETDCASGIYAIGGPMKG